MRGLRDKVCLVTGAGGAIGRAICLRFAEEGAVPVVVDKNAGAAEATVRDVEAAGGRAHAVTCDITDHAAVAGAVAQAEERAGAIDVLVNNAGWDRFAPFLDTGPELWDTLIAINLRGPLNVHHAVVKRMVARGRGRVVNIASDAARVGSSGEAVYAACKAGVVAFSKTLARELAQVPIHVNVVCPGPTETPLFRSFLGEGEEGKRVYEALKKAIPFRRYGQPGDIAGIVAFLASDDAAYITGQVVSVSGGLTMAG